MVVSQWGKAFEGTAGTPMDQCMQVALAQAEAESWQDGAPCEIIQLLVCWETVKGNARNYSWEWSMAKASIGIRCFFCKTGRLNSISCICLCKSECSAEGRGVNLYHVLSLTDLPKRIFSQITVHRQLTSSMNLFVQWWWLSSSCPPIITEYRLLNIYLKVSLKLYFCCDSYIYVLLCMEREKAHLIAKE